MSRFVSVSERGLEGTFSARQPGWLSRWSTDLLRVRSQDRGDTVHLNRTSAALWLLCDGQMEFGRIRDLIIERFPGREEQVARDVSMALLDLQTKGLVRIHDRPAATQPLLRVGFRNMWPSFDADRSYLAWMLTRRFDVLLVDPQHEAADLVITANSAEQYTDPVQAEYKAAQNEKAGEAGPALSLVVTIEEHDLDHGPDLDRYDYALTPSRIAAGFADRHQILPGWVHFVAWERYPASHRGAGEVQVLGPYEPDLVCERLYQALLSSLVESEEASVASPPSGKRDAG